MFVIVKCLFGKEQYQQLSDIDMGRVNYFLYGSKYGTLMYSYVITVSFSTSNQVAYAVMVNFICNV